MTGYVLMNRDGKYFGAGGWNEDIRDARPFTAEQALKLMRVFPKCKVSAIQVNLAYEPENLPASPLFQSFSRAVAA